MQERAGPPPAARIPRDQPKGVVMNRNPSPSPSPPPRSPRARTSQHFEDHRALQTVLGRLEASTDIQLLLPLLEELHRLLQGHFAREEAPDGFRAVFEESPHLYDALDGLLGQHPKFLRDIDQMTRDARACLEGPMAKLREEVRVLCDRLHDHEAEETRLLTEALYTDLGESS